VVGSLSKAFSCLGGFVGCPAEFKRLLKIRSNSYVFGGPVAPCYLEAVCTVVDILQSSEFEALQQRLRTNLDTLVRSAESLHYIVLGGLTPIVSLLIGDEEDTLRAGKFLFEHGYYAQSVTFPAVPYRSGVLRIQVNANHELEQVKGLVRVLAKLQSHLQIPRRSQAA
jgi:7-keto-8-aminopelargonate synthetase-like enzyme